MLFIFLQGCAVSSQDKLIWFMYFSIYFLIINHFQHVRFQKYHCNLNVRSFLITFWFFGLIWNERLYSLFMQTLRRKYNLTFLYRQIMFFTSSYCRMIYPFRYMLLTKEIGWPVWPKVGKFHFLPLKYSQLTHQKRSNADSIFP